MIRSLQVERFRGLQALSVSDLGRVNVIVGKNDCGKTTLLGAAAFTLGGMGALTSWARYLGHVQLRDADFERVYRPMFHGGDPTHPIRLSAVTEGGDSLQTEFQATRTGRGWSFPIEATYSGMLEGHASARLVDPDRIEVDDLHERLSGWWSGPYPDAEDDLGNALATVYTEGNHPKVVAIVRSIFPHVEAVDLVGDRIYVRLTGHALPLPISVLGDGARRVLDFSVGLVMAGPLYIDEIENGLHWSVLRRIWELLRIHQGQAFATTHRDEAIRLACNEFVEANDDGLRVIRLERTVSVHRAVVYTASQALAALDADLEIRG